MAADFIRRSALCLCLLGVLPPLAGADEGMWLLNEPPTELLQQRYRFTPSPIWLDKVQKSCVRLGRGGSASLISPHGLAMTNHHVLSGQIQKLSTAERNLLADGFLARTPDEELRCVDLDAYILMNIRDVTDQVRSVVQPGMDPVAAEQARKRKIAELESVDADDGGIRRQVVTLYRGAAYHLYRYQRYDDVRLVWAPEDSVASFGGDVDNFEFPRYALDMALVRIYHDGRPLQSPEYFAWSEEGPSEDDLVMVVGNPFRTQRLLTVDHLRYLRDVEYPTVLQRLWRREVQLTNFCDRSDEHRRIAVEDLSGVQNSRKAVTGYLRALHEPAVWQRLRDKEQKLRNAVAASPEWNADWSDAWTRLSAALENLRSFHDRYQALEGRSAALRSTMLGWASHLVRVAEELPKPNAERLPEYQDSELESLKLRLFSTAPVHDALEIDQIASGLSLLAETFGFEDPLTQELLAGKSPRERAAQVISGSALRDVAQRRKLFEGGTDALRASDDALIRFAALLDPHVRTVRKRYETEFEAVERDAYARIAAAQFAVNGRSIAPDASGTLRLSFGAVRAIPGDAPIPAFTEVGGAFERMQSRGAEPPFKLPDSWLAARASLDASVPLNFVSTADVIGGNSGSPVIDRAGQIVGLIFDINLDALGWNTVYDDRTARSIAVDSRAILHLLQHVYRAEALVHEIYGPDRRAGG